MLAKPYVVLLSAAIGLAVLCLAWLLNFTEEDTEDVAVQGIIESVEPDALRDTHLPKAKVDAQVPSNLSRPWHDETSHNAKVESKPLTPLKTFMLLSEPNSRNPLNPLGDALKKFGLTLSAEGELNSRPSIVLAATSRAYNEFMRALETPPLMDIGGIKNDTLLVRQPATLISYVNSPCLWGQASARYTCLEDFARSRGCELSRVAYRTYRVDQEHECIQVISTLIAQEMSEESKQASISGNVYYFFPGKSGDGGDGARIKSITQRYRGLMTQRRSVQSFKSTDQTLEEDESASVIESFCRKPRQAADAIQLRPANVTETFSVAVLIALGSPLVAFGQILDNNRISDRTRRRALRLAGFAAEAVQFSLPTTKEAMRTADLVSRFQAFSVRVGVTADDDVRLISFKGSPQLDDATWNSFLAKVSEMGVWGRFPVSPSYKSTSVFVVADQRQTRTDKDDDEAEDAAICSDKQNSVIPFAQKIIAKRSVPLCRTGQVAFGSQVSCSDLGFHPSSRSINDITAAMKAVKKQFRYSETERVCGASEMIALGSFIRSQASGVKLLPRKCSGFVSFAEAKQFCKGAGARLCTFSELVAAQLTANTGCEGDVRRVWTLTRCSDDPPSYWTGPGEAIKPLNSSDAAVSSRTFPARCMRVDDAATSIFQPLVIARCCADEATPTCLRDDHPKLWMPSLSKLGVPETETRCNDMEKRGSELTCAELRFKLLESRDVTNNLGHRVCARVIEPEGIPPLPDAGACTMEHKTFAEARRICDAMGARLCTLKELISGGSTNPLPMRACLWKNGVQAWTSEACPDAGQVTVASPITGSRCVLPKSSQVALVACCGDEFGRYCSTEAA